MYASVEGNDKMTYPCRNNEYVWCTKWQTPPLNVQGGADFVCLPSAIQRVSDSPSILPQRMLQSVVQQGIYICTHKNYRKEKLSMIYYGEQSILGQDILQHGTLCQGILRQGILQQGILQSERVWQGVLG